MAQAPAAAFPLTDRPHLCPEVGGRQPVTLRVLQEEHREARLTLRPPSLAAPYAPVQSWQHRPEKLIFESCGYEANVSACPTPVHPHSPHSTGSDSGLLRRAQHGQGVVGRGGHSGGDVGTPEPGTLPPQYLGSMLIKDLRGTESTQDACAKMRVGDLCGVKRGWLGTSCSHWGPMSGAGGREAVGCGSLGLGPEQAFTGLFPTEIHRAHEKGPHHHPVHHLQRRQVHRCLQQGALPLPHSPVSLHPHPHPDPDHTLVTTLRVFPTWTPSPACMLTGLCGGRPVLSTGLPMPGSLPANALPSRPTWRRRAGEPVSCCAQEGRPQT